MVVTSPKFTLMATLKSCRSYIIRLAALKVEEVTSDSHVYNSGEDTWKVSRISSSLPALKTHCKK